MSNASFKKKQKSERTVLGLRETEEVLHTIK